MDLRTKTGPFANLPKSVSETGLYQPVSFWQQTVNITPTPPLSEDLSCDVAIIGGGYTGLSVAYELTKTAPSLDVVLLERDVVGHGASGRNGGFIMPLLGWDLSHAAAKLGEDTAGQAYRLMYDAVEHTKNLVRENDIQCDLEETGYLLLATCSARQKRLREELALAHRLGFDHQWLEGDALRQHIRSASFRSGCFDPHPAIVNPAKLARGLKSVLDGLGVRVCEQTPLDELIDGQPALLRTSKASVRARQVVLAVNGYGAALGFMPSRVHPVHTYLVLTEPLSDSDLEAIGWSSKRTSLETARNFIHYFRVTADNRILFGGEDATIFLGGKFRDTHSPTFRRLEARFREYFPALDHVQFTHWWGGVLGVTLDMFPTFGTGGRYDSIHYATGYSGHGVALSNYAGKILAPRILEQFGLAEPDPDTSAPFFFGRKPTAVPPDPLRFVGLQAYRAALHAHDWWQKA